MKLKIRSIALILIIATLCAVFASCASDNEDLLGQGSQFPYTGAVGGLDGLGSESLAPDGNKDNGSNDIDDTPVTSEPIPAGAYVLFKDGKYPFKAVIPDNATESEKAVYDKLRTNIKNKTKSTLTTNTDYLASGATHPADEYAILVGLTNYSESQKVYSETSAGTYGVKISGKKIVFYFSTREEGLALVYEFCKAIKANTEKSFWINGSFSISKKTDFKLESVPNYPTSTTSYNCYDDTTMLLAKNTDLTTFNTYCNTVKSSGFTEYSKRDNVNGNYFRTYTKGTMALTVYFTAYAKTVRIISGPLSDIPSKEAYSTAETNTKPSVTLLNQGTKSNGTQQGSGLGIIYHLPNGKFLIYDGGYKANDGLYTTLKKLAGNSKIVIAAWIISHPHADHEEAFDTFIDKHLKDVRIENIMYNYTKFSDQYGNSDTIKNYIKKLDRTTNVIKPHSGQIYNFGSSSVEILYTIEDFMPTTLDDINTASMIVRVKVKGQTTILLGDALEKAATILTNMYGAHLKSDMVQLAHHGTTPGTKALYTNINAPVLFWPSSADNVKNRYYNQSNAALIEAVSKAKDIYLASEGTATLTLPYTIKNNKDAFLKRMK
ncbi:MAG: hypothetical protein J6U68_04260 [Clostridia bacterium]|nr:hypothetical protein [Clostridia bacterium]